jgi:hypothetical protein
MCPRVQAGGAGAFRTEDAMRSSLMWLADVELTLGDPFRALQLSEDSLEGA